MYEHLTALGQLPTRRADEIAGSSAEVARAAGEVAEASAQARDAGDAVLRELEALGAASAENRMAARTSAVAAAELIGDADQLAERVAGFRIDDRDLSVAAEAVPAEVAEVQGAEAEAVEPVEPAGATQRPAGRPVVTGPSRPRRSSGRTIPLKAAAMADRD